MRVFALVSAICAIFGVTSCGGGNDSSTRSSESTGAATATAEVKLLEPKAKPVLVPPKGPPPKKLVINDLTVGSGATAEAGDKVTAEYTGFNYVNHEEFTNHAHRWGEGEPLVFEVAGGELIPGMDQGVEEMKVGGRRELIIPPDLAYGNTDPPPEVGPDETVIYVVELLGVE
jgi:peptidylprolyl isomerase